VEAIKSTAATAAAFSGSKLERPSWLKGEAKKAWVQFIEPATWIDGARAPAAIAFCALWAEFRESPTNFQSARHSQMRSYMADLGLTDERNRTAPPDVADDDLFA